MEEKESILMCQSKTVLRTAVLSYLALSSTLSFAEDRNWVVYNVVESFYPLPAEESFPEHLASLETIFELFDRRRAIRDVERALHLGRIGHGKADRFGDRSDMGHDLLWIHLSDKFLATHKVDRKALGEQIFLFPDRETDIFTAWSGNVNLVSFLVNGVQGLANPLPGAIPGTPGGNFQSFSSIWTIGDADYEGGWYLKDSQAEQILTAFQTYPGATQGYSFMRRTEERPNAPYEPVGAQLVNGYNCNDFVWYALELAGVISKDEAESLKIQFWYPRYYFDHPLPLKGVGAKGADWIHQHPGSTSLPGDVMTRLGWFDLLFSPEGIQFFDKAAVVESIVRDQLHLIPARVWDQTHTIAWLTDHAEFRGKGISSEILPTLLANGRFETPLRQVEPTSRNRWAYSQEWARNMSDGTNMQLRKLKKSHLSGEEKVMFDEIYESLKDQLPMPVK